MNKLLVIVTVAFAGCSSTHVPCPAQPDADAVVVLDGGASTLPDAGSANLLDGSLTRPSACQMVLFPFEAKRDGFAAVVDAPCADLTWTCPWAYPTTSCDPVLVEECFVAVTVANTCFNLNRAVLDCAAEACQ